MEMSEKSQGSLRERELLDTVSVPHQPHGPIDASTAGPWSARSRLLDPFFLNSTGASG